MFDINTDVHPALLQIRFTLVGPGPVALLFNSTTRSLMPKSNNKCIKNNTTLREPILILRGSAVAVQCKGSGPWTHSKH